MGAIAPGQDAPPLVLIVDDAEDARLLYVEYLRLHGYRTEVAADGFQAVEKATLLQPDIVVMDLAMPRLNGWEATRRLKSAAGTASIPVVALTGHDLEHYRAVALAAGCEAFLAKPCEPRRLLAEIRRLLKQEA